jgi:hypothetical protein
MHMLHDAADRQAIAARIRSLRTDSPRRWGRMTIDQMLWHVNQGLLTSLGDLAVAPIGVPIPASVMKWMVLRVPWPRGAPTAPEYVARANYQFEPGRAALLQSLEAFAGRDPAGSWPRHPGFGLMTGRDWSCLMHKHLDHHLRQFSA